MLNDHIEPCCENCRHLNEVTNRCLELSRFRRKINNSKESLCDYHDYKDSDDEYKYEEDGDDEL